MTRVRRGPVAAGVAIVFVVSSCGATRALSTPSPPASLSLHIHLDATRVAAGHRLRGTLVVDNPGSPLNLTRGERSGCRPGFEISLTRGGVNNFAGFTLDCVSGPFSIPHGTTRLPFSVLTYSVDCLPPDGQSLTSVPNCLSSGGEPPLPTGFYRAVIDWSEPVPLPRPTSVAIVLT